jgi:hypothetical protein
MQASRLQARAARTKRLRPKSKANLPPQRPSLPHRRTQRKPLTKQRLKAKKLRRRAMHAGRPLTIGRQYAAATTKKVFERKPFGWPWLPAAGHCVT